MSKACVKDKVSGGWSNNFINRWWICYIYLSLYLVLVLAVALSLSPSFPLFLSLPPSPIYFFKVIYLLLSFALSLSPSSPSPSLSLSLSLSLSTSFACKFFTSCFSLLFHTTFDRFECIFGSVDSIRRDIKEMREKLNEFEPQIGFCHNDLSHANIIYNEEEGIL